MKTKILSVFLALVMMISVLPANMMTAHAQEVEDYTITFAPGTLCLFNGEGAYETRAFTPGSDTFLLPEPADVNLVGRMDNFTFAGWVVEGTSAPVYAAGENVADLIKGDMTFLANFEEPAIPGMVSYTINPGEIANDTTNRAQSVGPIPEEYVTDISLPATDEKIENAYGWVIPEGYSFANWENNRHETFPVKEGFTVPFTPENGQTYTAIWVKEDVKIVTVTLNPGSIDGTPVTAQPVEGGKFAEGSAYYGPSVNPFAEQEINGETYRAVGWSYTDGGEAINFDEPITLTEDLTLYAVWEKDTTETWNVTLKPGEDATFVKEYGNFVNEDGTLVAHISKDAEDKQLHLPGEEVFATKPEGKTLSGWVDSEGTEYAIDEIITVTSNMDFTPVWVDAANA